MKVVIINGDEKVIDVACAAGFTSLSAFNRFFKNRWDRHHQNIERTSQSHL